MASTDASLFKLNFKPGINRETTRYSEEGGWYDADKVRFRRGRPENLRGWAKKSSVNFEGSARDLLIWSDYDTRKLTSFATEKLWYVYDDVSVYDITPVVSSETLTSSFATSIGSFLVEVSLAAHGRSAGDFVVFTSSTTIGGNIVLTSAGYGGPRFEVVTAADANTFTISVASAADSTEVSAGTASVDFLLPVGTNVATQGLGWGAGKWNAGVSIMGARGWNDPATSSNITFAATQWTLDQWGEDMIGCRRGGRMYFWDRDASVTPSRATLITNSPSVTDFMLISPNDRHVIALGTEGFADSYNPLRVRWADQNDYNNWTPSISSTSGETDLTGGTKIVGGTRSRNQVNIWTDTALYGMTYVGNPFTYSFRMLGDNCGLIAPHAAVDYDGVPMWMGHSNFYAFDGQVKNLASTVRRYIYDDLNNTQKDKVFAGINSEFKEVIWLYPSTDGTECDSYVIYNPEENHWVYGTTKWTTFKDRHIYGNTITTGSDSYLYDNEPKGEFSGDGDAVPSFLESADFDLQEGDNIIFVDRIIPDFTLNNGTLSFTITTKQYPTGPEIEKGPYIITCDTRKVDVRARGRQARVRVSTASDGVEWRQGSTRISGQADGGR
jgi:hypothetical protein